MIEPGDLLLGRYEIRKLAGHGGMADVYVAFDRRRRATVAVKSLHEDLAEDPEFLRRFQREAAALARLDHPHIVRFYSFEQQGRVAFIVMDYIAGSTLRGRLRDVGGPLPLTEATRVLEQVVSALHFAHAEGVIHRDIKPANIMLREEGTVLLSDFGIARAVEGASLTTMAVGTPPYMSPEQILGRPPDTRTDIYSLGVVLFEMATGRRPFVGAAGAGTTTAERLRNEHLHSEPPDPRRLNPVLPPAVASVISRALAKRPEDRWPDVGSLYEAWALGVGPQGETDARSAEADQPIEKSAWREVNAEPDGEAQPVRAASALGTVQATHKSRLSMGLLAAGGVLLAGLLAVGPFLALRGASSAKPMSPPRPTVQVVAANAGATKAPPTATPATVAGPMRTHTDTPRPTQTAALAATSTFTATPQPTLGIGSTRVSPLDGMVQVFVPAGDFLMGSTANDAEAYNDEKPQHRVYLDAYWIDSTEVTKEQYQKCVASGKCAAPTCSGTEPGNHPAVCVAWRDAENYCVWAGRRLPTEAEWEKAARGIDGRKYPWGNDPPDDRRLNSDNAVGSTTPVGAYPTGVSPYGALDMAGNVWEWVSDWYGENYYLNALLRNPTGPDLGQFRVLRGGAWSNRQRATLAAFRSWSSWDSRGANLGFRCVRSS